MMLVVMMTLIVMLVVARDDDIDGDVGGDAWWSRRSEREHVQISGSVGARSFISAKLFLKSSKFSKIYIFQILDTVSDYLQ